MSANARFVRDHYPHCTTADGFDDAIIGMLLRPGRPAVVVYDVDRVIDVVLQEGVSREEAEEYVQFNVTSAYVGQCTPLFVRVESQHEQ